MPGKTAAILTLVCYNIGNRLQNYAVQEMLREAGVTPETVRLKSGAIPVLRNFVRKRIIKNETSRMRDFNGRRVAWSGYGMPDDIPPGAYDYFIVGSDQIWNPTWLDDAGYEKYLLSFAPPEKRIAFSASFGVYSVPEEKRAPYREELPKFNALSVREDAGARIVKELSGRDAEVLIDPALMLTRGRWESIAEPPRRVPDLSRPYVLTYFLGGPSERAREDLRRLAGRDPVYRLVDPAAPEFYCSVGPAEFVYLISRAKIVLTDSFHASVFSFLMGVPFLVYDRVDFTGDTSMNSRLDTLFGKFDLSRKYATNGIRCDPFERDYSAAYVKLGKERERAREFLRKALN